MIKEYEKKENIFSQKKFILFSPEHLKNISWNQFAQTQRFVNEKIDFTEIFEKQRAIKIQSDTVLYQQSDFRTW